MKKIHITVGSLIFFLFFLPLLIFIWWNNQTSPINIKDSSQHDFLITRGQPLIKVAENLEKEGLIKNKLVFKLYAQISGKDKKIQAGEYKLSPNLSLQQLVQALIFGPQELWVTIPEGFRKEEIAYRIIKTLEIKDDQAKIFFTEFIKETKDQEGYFFPDTYLFPKDITAVKVVLTLKNTFIKRVTLDLVESARKNGLTQNEILVLASIVERETKTGTERPIVAGILLNRLNLGMALQVDATLQYITGTTRCGGKYYLECNWWGVPTVQEKQLRSAFNTYLNIGLPPTPIANPGIEAIEAVVRPEESDFLYYIHGSDGKIHYAKTLDEHNQNISKYLR